MLGHNFRKFGHIICIFTCISIAGIIFSYPDNIIGKNPKHTGITTNQIVNHIAHQGKSFGTELPENRKAEMSQQSEFNSNPKNAASVKPQKKNSIKSGINDGLVKLPMPDIKLEFSKVKLSILDEKADRLISVGDTNGLVDLKEQIVSGVPEQWRKSLLKADYYANYSSLCPAERDPNASKAVNTYLNHCKASLELLHRLDPEDPFYFLKTATLTLKNNPAQAMGIAQNGLDLLARRSDLNLADTFYYWKLTQLKAIVLSTSDKNQESLAAVKDYIRRIEQLPEDERGIIKEAMLVKNWLESGKAFKDFVRCGKIIEAKSEKK